MTLSHLRLHGRRQLALLGFVFGSLLVAPSVSAQVVSHTFEDGTQGWGPRGPVSVTSSDEMARTGSRSLKTTGRTASWNGPALNVLSTLTPGVPYQFTAWVRLVAGTSASNIALTLENRPVGGTTGWTNIATASGVTDGGWVRLQGTYTVPAPLEHASLYFESPNAAAEFYVDDFTIHALTASGCPEPLDQSGLDTGFESGSTQGWTPRGGVTLTPTTEAAASGSYSLRVTGRTASWQGPAINVHCKLHPGTKYLIAVKVRLLPGETASQVRVSFQHSLAGGPAQFTTVIGNTAVTDAGWTELVTEHTFGLAADQLSLYVETASGTASFYIDDFLLEPVSVAPVQTDLPALQDELAAYFPIGAAIEPAETLGRHAELLLHHFNLVVAGNAMKWSSLQPTEGNFNWGPADVIANFARAHDLRMRGHTLVWHSQVPNWVFQDAAGNPLDGSNEAHRQLLRDRLRTHIHAVVSRYGDIVDSWDVVNEVIDANGPNGLRQSRWYDVLGEEYIHLAFQYASEVAGDALLFINDYNTNEAAKRAALQALVQRLLDAGAPVDGVGHQMHVNINWPSVSDIRQTLELFAGMGLINEITEMDMSVYTNSTDTSPVTEEALIRQGYRYRDIFNLYRELHAIINSVTLWGLADDNTWLKTFPITRDDKPLLFDEDLQAKPAYWGVVDPSKLPIVPKALNVVAADAKVSAAVEPIWTYLAAQPLTSNRGDASWASVRLAWQGNQLHLLVEVRDETKDASDKVEVFLGDGEPLVFSGFGRQRPGGADGIITPIDGGYRLKASIPVGALQPGDALLFDVRVTDGSTGAALSWSDTAHGQDDDRDGLGTLTLLAAKQVAEVKHGTPIVDGLADVVWRKATALQTTRFVEGTAGATATIELLWDENYLYVYATVMDPVLNAQHAQPWQQDSVEIFVDANNAQTGAYQADDGQYRVNFLNAQSYGGAASAATFATATRVIEGGYVVEAAIDLADAALVRGNVLGFDFQVNDNNGGDRASVATWNDTSGRAYTDPSQFGAVKLVK